MVQFLVIVSMELVLFADSEICLKEYAERKGINNEGREKERFLFIAL
jgi:hypothetical protein